MRNAVASLTLSNRCRRSRSVLAASDRLIVLSPVNTKPHHIPLALSLAAIRCYIVHLVTPKSPRLRNPTQLRDISKFARIQINNFPTERTSVYVAETTCNKKFVMKMQAYEHICTPILHDSTGCAKNPDLGPILRHYVSLNIWNSRKKYDNKVYSTITSHKIIVCL